MTNIAVKECVLAFADLMLAGNYDHFDPLRSGHDSSGPKPTEP